MAKKEENKEIKKETNKHEVAVKIEGDSWKNAIDKVFDKKQKTVKVDGFRQGKVPRKDLENELGESVVTSNNVLNYEYVDEKEIEMQ